jgi:hypothetical protein
MDRLFVVSAIVALAGCSGGAGPTSQSSLVPQSATKARVPSSFASVRTQGARVHPHEVGPGCTQVSVSQNVQNRLGGPGPYSAEIAVTTSQSSVNVGNIDAHGCDFGVYVGTGVTGVTVTNNQVHDADQAGILVDGATYVNLTGNSVSQIGNHVSGIFAPNGVQTGLAVYYDAGSGLIKNNEITQYQKNGITLIDNSTVGLNGNLVIGLASPGQKTAFIAQNGIEVIGTALTHVSGNTALYNEYAYPDNSATGFLICNATLNGTLITTLKQIQPKNRRQQNIAEHNDINFFISPSPSC